MSGDKVISPAEVAKHKTDGDAWLIVEGGIYNVSEFLGEHPGGKKILLKSCGADATEAFWKYHSKKILTKTAAPMKIGVVGADAKL